MPGSRPAIRAVMSWPVRAPRHSPKWPWPNAKNALRRRGEGDITGTVSGRLGRCPIQRETLRSCTPGSSCFVCAINTSARRQSGAASNPASSTVSGQAKAKQGLHEIWMVETRAQAQRAFDDWLKRYDDKVARTGSEGANRRRLEDFDRFRRSA